MVAVPGCRCIGFSVSPVPPRETNPSELIIGASYWVHVRQTGTIDQFLVNGLVVTPRIVNNNVTIYYYTDSDGLGYYWDGSIYVKQDSAELTIETANMAVDMIRQFYNEQFNNWDMTPQAIVTEEANLPRQIVAIIQD